MTYSFLSVLYSIIVLNKIFYKFYQTLYRLTLETIYTPYFTERGLYYFSGVVSHWHMHHLFLRGIFGSIIC
jgi:hypothetical protein